MRLAVENARRQTDVAELLGALRDLVTGLPWLSEAAPDPAVREIATSLGLGPQELAIVGAVTGTPLTLVGVPDAVWRNPALRRDVTRLRHRARRAGCRTLIVPWCAAVRQPRLGNMALISSAARRGASARSRRAVLDRVATEPVVTFGELAVAADGGDLTNAALCLVGTGHLRIPTASPLEAGAPVRFRRPSATLRRA